MKEILIIFTYTFLVGILSIALYKAIPSVKQYLKRVITRIPRKKNTRTPVDCVVLEKRIASLEKRLEKRQENYRQAMRQEIKNVLIELKKQ